jgi:hypothetical protein
MNDESKIAKALDIADRYGTADGAHHKMWVIDQMVRLLCGNKREYIRWIAKHSKGDDGPNTYSWDEGVPP